MSDHLQDAKESDAASSIHANTGVPFGNAMLPEGSLDPVYQAKAQILNGAMQEVGMGKYQWQLFVVTGFGWFADNLWPIVTGLILTPVMQEFNFQGPFLKLGQNIGLLVGAAAWGLASDVWGRRILFNVTLFILGLFATVAGASPNHIALTSFAALWSVGVGGNLPVDSAIFLEFIPGSHQYLLTALSVWWAIGQLVGSLVAWPLIGSFSCPTTTPRTPCHRSDNMGWRYFLFSMGGLMVLFWGVRFFLFKLYESPKFLMGRGMDAEAVEVVQKVAQYNGRSSTLTLEQLSGVSKDKAGFKQDTSAKGAALRKLEGLSGNRIKSLFATRNFAISTSLLIVIWALIGLAFPLYNAFVTYFLATRGADFGDGSNYITYRNQAVLSVIGVPGALLASWAVEIPWLGRKGSLSISTILTGVFLFASTTARSSNALLGWNCGYSFTSNIMYGVLYAFSPEQNLAEPATRLSRPRIAFSVSCMCRSSVIKYTLMDGFIRAPIVALYADLTSSVPIFISGALFVVAGVIAVLLPIEARGKTSL